MHIAAMTTPEAADRVVARHHLLGEARTNRPPREKFDEHRNAFVHFIRDRAAAADHPVSTADAELLIVLIDGLTHRQVFFPDSALDHNQIHSIIDTAVRAIEDR
ncbi:hypothetical protein [Nocardia sp. NPDC004711]